MEAAATAKNRSKNADTLDEERALFEYNLTSTCQNLQTLREKKVNDRMKIRIPEAFYSSTRYSNTT
jgi:hypothetical protein